MMNFLLPSIFIKSAIQVDIRTNSKAVIMKNYTVAVLAYLCCHTLAFIWSFVEESPVNSNLLYLPGKKKIRLFNNKLLTLVVTYIMFLSCSYHVPIMFLSCSYHVPIMFLSCSYHVPIMFIVPIMFLSCSYHVPIVFLLCSYRVPIMFLSCSYHVHIVFLSCSYRVPIMFLSCPYNVPIMFLSCSYHVHIMHLSCAYHDTQFTLFLKTIMMLKYCNFSFFHVFVIFS